MQLRQLILFLAFCLINIVCACSSKIDQSSLTGVYLSKYSYGDEILILYANNSYKQEFFYNDNKANESNLGVWYLRIDEQEIVLKDAKNIDDDFGSPSKKVVVSNLVMGITTAEGKLSLTRNSDLNISFLKVD